MCFLTNKMVNLNIIWNQLLIRNETKGLSSRNLLFFLNLWCHSHKGLNPFLKEEDSCIHRIRISRITCLWAMTYNAMQFPFTIDLTNKRTTTITVATWYFCFSAISRAKHWWCDRELRVFYFVELEACFVGDDSLFSLLEFDAHPSCNISCTPA